MVVLTALGPDPHKYVLVGMFGAISAGSLRSVMTKACFQPDVATYLDSCSIVSAKCASSLAVPDVENTYLYPSVGAQNVFFVVIGALLAIPDFFQGFFPFFATLHTLDFIGILLIENYLCLSTLLVNWM